MDTWFLSPHVGARDQGHDLERDTGASVKRKTLSQASHSKCSGGSVATTGAGSGRLQEWTANWIKRSLSGNSQKLTVIGIL